MKVIAGMASKERPNQLPLLGDFSAIVVYCGLKLSVVAHHLQKEIQTRNQMFLIFKPKGASISAKHQTNQKIIQFLNSYRKKGTEVNQSPCLSKKSKTCYL